MTQQRPTLVTNIGRGVLSGVAHRRNEREVEHSMQNLKDLAEHRSR